MKYNKKIYQKIIKEFGGYIQEREDGRIEWICKHGIGHTIDSPRDGKYEYVHGCDGCCVAIFKFITKIELENKSKSFIL